MQNSYISIELIKAILSEYTLPWDGIHGLSHWARVMENGLRLAEVNGADKSLLLYLLFSMTPNAKTKAKTMGMESVEVNLHNPSWVRFLILIAGGSIYSIMHANIIQKDSQKETLQYKHAGTQTDSILTELK